MWRLERRFEPEIRKAPLPLRDGEEGARVGGGLSCSNFLSCNFTRGAVGGGTLFPTDDCACFYVEANVRPLESCIYIEYEHGKVASFVEGNGLRFIVEEL
jgi:hypothetical protein